MKYIYIFLDKKEPIFQIIIIRILFYTIQLLEQKLFIFGLLNNDKYGKIWKEKIIFICQTAVICDSYDLVHVGFAEESKLLLGGKTLF